MVADKFNENINFIIKTFNICFEKHEVDSDNYILEKAKDSNNVLKIKIEDKWIYLGSKYNRQKDVENFIGKINDECGYVHIVIGFGYGDHLREMLNRYPNDKILVLEPDEEIIKYFAENADIGWIKNSNLLVKIYRNESEAKEILYQNFFNYRLKGITLDIYSNYNTIYSKQVSAAVNAVKEFYSFLNLNQTTKKTYAKQFLQEHICNLPVMFKSYPVNCLRGIFTNIPAVIVSSGPSLEKSIDQIKNIAGRCIIISGGRNLKGLIENGLRPDLVCAADPGEIMYELMKCNMREEIPLVLTDCVNHKISEEYVGLKFYTSASGPKTNKRLTGKDIFLLPQGGSVAHMCTSLAAYIGCNPVVMVGQDLAYTGNKVHAGMATFNGLDMGEICVNESHFYVEGSNGKNVITDTKLNAFRIWLEKFIEANKSIEFINCTLDGAKIKGANISPLESVAFLQSVDCKNKIDKCLKEEDILAPHYREAVNGIIKDLDVLEEKIAKIYNITKREEELEQVLKKMTEIWELIENSMLQYQFSGIQNYYDGAIKEINELRRLIEEVFKFSIRE